MLTASTALDSANFYIKLRLSMPIARSRFSCLPFVALVASTAIAHSPLHPVSHRILGHTHTTAHPDTSTASTPVLLTVENLTAYVSADTALETYRVAHPDLSRADSAHMLRQAIPTVKGMDVSIELIDYTAVAAQDTAVAVIFTKHHITPGQYVAVRGATYYAIGAVVAGDTATPATVEGKNMAFVQAHRVELAPQWKQIGRLEDGMKQLLQKIKQAGANQMNMNPGMGGGSDLTP